MESEYQRAVLQSRILWIWMRQSIERGDEKRVQEKYMDAWDTGADNIMKHRTTLREATILHNICPSIQWQANFKKQKIFRRNEEGN